MKRALAAALLTMMVFALTPAQALPRRLLLYMAALPGSRLSESELVVLCQTLVGRLSQDTSSLLPVEAETLGSAPASASDRSAEAWSRGADAWLWVGVGRGAAADSLVVRTQLFDIVAGGAVREQAVEEPRPAQMEALWDDVVSAVRSGFAANASAPAVAAGTTTQLVVRAAPGTRVSGLPGGELVVGSSGQATTAVAALATYTITAHHPAYRSAPRSVYAQGPSVVVDCAQTRIRPWALELGLSKLAYPSFRLLWLPLADRGFVSLGWTSYTVGLPSWSENDDRTDLPLNEIGVSAAVYLTRPQALLRPYIGADAFVRLLNNGSDRWLGVELEPLSWGGFGAEAGLEVARHPVLRPFVEYRPRAYVLSDPAETRSYYDTLQMFGRSVPRYVYLDSILVDLASFEMGLRIRL